MHRQYEYEYANVPFSLSQFKVNDPSFTEASKQSTVSSSPRSIVRVLALVLVYPIEYPETQED